jgi:hypothetical protein
MYHVLKIHVIVVQSIGTHFFWHKWCHRCNIVWHAAFDPYTVCAIDSLVVVHHESFAE